MNEIEAMKTTAVLSSYFPGALPEPTARAWSEAVEKYEYPDAVRAAKTLATQVDRPTLARWCRAIESERDRRLEAQPLLMQGEISDDQATRNAAQARKIIKQLAGDIPSLTRKKQPSPESNDVALQPASNARPQGPTRRTGVTKPAPGPAGPTGSRTIVADAGKPEATERAPRSLENPHKETCDD